MHKCEWVVYTKHPFAGPKAVLEYLSRYTHRVAISNQRLVAFDERGVTFRWKDYRAKGRTRYKTMTLEASEFMRRFLLHVLPGGFHRIRHYGLLANPARCARLARIRDLLHVVPDIRPPTDDAIIEVRPVFTCRHCGAPMIVIDILARSAPIRAPADAPGSDMNYTGPRYPNRPSALRQRSPREDVCVCRFAKRFAHPLHHRECTTAPLRSGVSDAPAPRLSVPHPAPQSIAAYQSP